MDNYVADDLNALYEIIPPAARHEKVLSRLPKTVKKYEEYEQWIDEFFGTDLPDTVKEFEEKCDFLTYWGCDFPGLMLIHIQGQRMKRRYLQHWKGIEDTRVRSLKNLFELYKGWWKVKDHEPMEPREEEDDLAETLDELLITPIAEELKSFFGIVTSKVLKECFMMDLPYTTEAYEEYKQQFQEKEKVLFTNLPMSLKEYEEYCEYIHTTLDLLPMHIVGEAMKKHDLQQIEAIEDIRVRSLQKLFEEYNECEDIRVRSLQKLSEVYKEE